MSLDLGEKLKGLLPDLDRTRVAFLSNACENCFSVCEDLDLADIVAGVTTILLILTIPDLSILSAHDATILSIGDVGNAKNRDVSDLKLKILLSLVLLAPSLQVVE